MTIEERGKKGESFVKKGPEQTVALFKVLTFCLVWICLY